MAFACNAIERVVERVGHVRGALVAVARAAGRAGRVRGCATNAVALLESHKSTRDLLDGGIVWQSIDNSECTALPQFSRHESRSQGCAAEHRPSVSTHTSPPLVE